MLPKTFWQTGNFEFFKVNFKKKVNSVSGKRIIPFFLSGKEILDIDSYSDIEKLNKKFFN